MTKIGFRVGHVEQGRVYYGRWDMTVRSGGYRCLSLVRKQVVVWRGGWSGMAGGPGGKLGSGNRAVRCERGIGSARNIEMALVGF